MGDTYIDTSCIDKKMKISLGRDEEILVDRKIVRKFTSTTLLRGLVVKDCEYGIQVINTKKEKINVQIIDQIPVSRNEKIFVECKEISGAKLNQEDGKLIWEYCIYDNHKVELTVAFSIKCPKEMMDFGI